MDVEKPRNQATEYVVENARRGDIGAVVREIEKTEAELKKDEEEGKALIASCATLESTVVTFFKELDHEYHCVIKKPILKNLGDNIGYLTKIKDDVALTEPIKQVLTLFATLHGTIQKGDYFRHLAHDICIHDSEYYFFNDDVYIPVKSLKELKTEVDSVEKSVQAEYNRYCAFQLNCIHLTLLFNCKHELQPDIKDEFYDVFVDLFSNSLRMNLALKVLKVRLPSRESPENIQFSVRDTLCRTYAIMDTMEEPVNILASRLKKHIDRVLPHQPERPVRHKALPKSSVFVHRADHDGPPERYEYEHRSPGEVHNAYNTPPGDEDDPNDHDSDGEP